MKPTIPGPMGPVPAASFNDRASITEVILPTLGIPYTGKDGQSLFPGGAIRISSMTVAEEKMMAQKNSDPARKMCVLLERVCDLRGVRADQLLTVDQYFLLIKIRALSYGNSYSFPFRCEDCAHQWKHKMNLETDMRLAVVDENWSEPFTLDLPSGKTIHYRMMRAIDEIELNNKRIRKDGVSDDPTFVSILSRLIMSIDGEAISNPRLAEAWLDKQSVMDRSVFTNSLEENTPGYAGGIQIVCPACGYVHEAAVPMTSEFFRADVPSRTVSTGFGD